jgi:hypothetical protein
MHLINRFLVGTATKKCGVALTGPITLTEVTFDRFSIPTGAGTIRALDEEEPHAVLELAKVEAHLWGHW